MRHTRKRYHIDDRREPHREGAEEEGLGAVVEHAGEDRWPDDVSQADLDVSFDLAMCSGAYQDTTKNAVNSMTLRQKMTMAMMSRPGNS